MVPGIIDDDKSKHGLSIRKGAGWKGKIPYIVEAKKRRNNPSNALGGQKKVKK